MVSDGVGRGKEVVGYDVTGLNGGVCVGVPGGVKKKKKQEQ